ncbi:MAG TPA: A/G-specific adenine glycosylase [Rhodanobacteraceae bacterium]|nr:A/G-specific adenine glycosylase [Rhodanobacteraceae bacterium]
MSDFAARLLCWFDAHGRHDLPWQHPREPYRVWLAEVMLQQTQVSTVVAYFERFVAALPNLTALAQTDLDHVLGLWSGLGYYQRARHLKRAAEVCQRDHAGALPREFAALAALPGIGRSTAGAILAQAYGLRFPILDGNVKRVLCRHHGIDAWPGEAAVTRQLWQLAEDHLPNQRIADYTQAIMDLGATVCTRARPRCGECPLQVTCVARRDGLTAGLPRRRTAKVKPERAIAMLLLRDRHGRILLLRRPPAGVWGGLWSLPEAGDDAVAATAALFARIQPESMRSLPPFAHEFSHFRLHVRPCVWLGVDPAPAIADNGGLKWCTREEWLQLGLPAPVRRLLETQVGENPCQEPCTA